MLDRQAEQLAETRVQIDALLEGQRMLVQIYSQEHDARVESERRFNRFIERTDRFIERTDRFMERTDRFIEWAQQILANHEERLNTLNDIVNEIRRYIRFNLENGHGGNGSEGPDLNSDPGE